MCPICLPILGSDCRPHNESKCPLQNAKYCSICGKGKHFMKDCPRQSKTIQKIYIPSIKPEAINSYLLSNNNSVYIEYLRSRGQTFTIPIAKNRQLVAEHLAKMGYVLTNPIETHATPDCGCSRCSKS